MLYQSANQVNSSKRRPADDVEERKETLNLICWTDRKLLDILSKIRNKCGNKYEIQKKSVDTATSCTFSKEM